MNGINPPQWGHPLEEKDYRNLEARWITRELAVQAQLRRVGSEEGAEVVGHRGRRDCAGILIPYYLPGAPDVINYRLRRDAPELLFNEKGEAKPEGKYLGAPGSGNRLYMVPATPVELLIDTSLPVTVTEGEFKTMALFRLAMHESDPARFLPIGLSGVWNWRGGVGKTDGPDGERVDVKGPISDLDRLSWTGRVVYIIFDTNVRSNPTVAAARIALSKELNGRGAEVCWVELPAGTSVNGVDDFLVEKGPEATLRLIAESTPVATTDKGTQAQLLVRLAEAEGVNLFHSVDGEAYASVPASGHMETWALRSKGFRRFLAYRFFQKFRKPPGTQAMQDAIGILEAKAQYESPQENVCTRVAAFKGRIYHDLANDAWEAVEISAEGWKIVPNPPVRFRRAKGMLSLPHPAATGSLALLRGLINIGNDKNWVLVLVWLVAALRDQGPYAILILQGEQGSAKSTTARFLRRIIDSCKALVRTPPREERDLLIAATNSWVIAYDNLSRIPIWLSDALCRLATGGGFSTRELYTDQEEIIFEAMRPVILNGIDHLPERADLADRAIILNVPRVERRIEERELNRRFEAALPKIMAGLYDALSMALKRLPETKLEQLPRMADFAAFGVAAESGLGVQAGTFLNAYLDNRGNAVESTLADDPVAATLRAFLDSLVGPEEWEGNSQELLIELERSLDEKIRKSNDWPKTPRGLSGRLRGLVTFLREAGIDVCFPEPGKKGTNGKRTITIRRIGTQNTATTASTATASGEGELIQQLTESGGCNRKVAVEQDSSDVPPLHTTAGNVSEPVENFVESGGTEDEVAVAPNPSDVPPLHTTAGKVLETQVGPAHSGGSGDSGGSQHSRSDSIPDTQREVFRI
jgi:hypothetical protein